MAKTTSPGILSFNDPNTVAHAFKTRLQTGEIMLGGMIMECIRPCISNIYKQAGYDFIYVETEHTMFDGSALADFLLGCRGNGIPTICKIPILNRAYVARYLDNGACGIQLPRTESREQVTELVDYMKFPPIGSRAAAPCFGNVDYCAPNDPTAWLDSCNRSTIVVAHVETRKGYKNAKEIITTPGLDMLYIGPYDFSVSMGQPGNYDHPDLSKPMQDILTLCLEYKVPFGTTASGPDAGRRWIEQGCQFFEVVDELSLISRGAFEAVRQYRM